MSKYLASIWRVFEERANKLPYDLISHSKVITCEDLFPDAYSTPYIPILHLFFVV